MNHSSFRAMGTDVEFWGERTDVEALRAWFEHVEQACSRFRPDSDLSAVNSDLSTRIRLGDPLLSVIQAGARIRTLTDGLVDIAVGNAVRAWGYDRTFERVTGLNRTPEDVVRPEWTLDDRVLNRPPGTLLDLGGVAKGWAADRAVESGMAEVVSAGGDLRSNHPDTVATVTDHNGDAVARIHVGGGALATSSTGRRTWQVAGDPVSHLIDPRTMRPVHGPVISATVVADTATEAEAGAKAVLIHGTDGLDWASRQNWIAAALVVWHDGSVYATADLEVVA